MPLKTLLEQGEDQIAAVAAAKPNAFTVGGSIDATGRVAGGITYDRHWSNGWGATAFARAWWDDLAVTPRKITAEAGAEIVKKF